MGVLVVVLLGALWASILAPGAVRVRRQSSPLASVTEFERSMGMLANRMNGTPFGPRQEPAGRYLMVLENPTRVTHGSGAALTLRRRRAVLQGLLGAAALLAPFALVGRGGWLFAFLLVLALLGAYVGVLAEIRNRELERRRKVRRLSARAAAARAAATASGEWWGAHGDGAYGDGAYGDGSVPARRAVGR